MKPVYCQNCKHLVFNPQAVRWECLASLKMGDWLSPNNPLHSPGHNNQNNNCSMYEDKKKSK